MVWNNCKVVKNNLFDTDYFLWVFYKSATFHPCFQKKSKKHT